MLEILLLLSLSRWIEKLATKKGEKPYRWRLIMVGSWFGAEFAGAFIAYLITNNLLYAYVAAIACAATSLFVVWNKLKQKPDKESWVDTIGVEAEK